MILVDTGFFLAIAQPRDSLHGLASAWLANLDGEQLVVTEHILLEVVNALSKGLRREVAQMIAEQVRHSGDYRFLPASPALLEAGLRLHRSRSDKDWSLTDCISFHVMRELGIARALAHDEHFEQAGFEALLRHPPA
jgi:predicted nucleic acid-binding protein